MPLRRRGKFSGSKVSRFRLGKFYLLIPLILIVVVGYLIFNSKVKNILVNVNNSKCISTSQVKESLNVSRTNILKLDTKQIKQDLEKRFICIDQVDVEKKLPDTLAITLTDKKGALVLKNLKVASNGADLDVSEVVVSTESSNLVLNKDALKEKNRLVLDDKGFVFSDDESKYPAYVVDYIGEDLKLGGVSNEELKNSVFLIKLLQEKKLEIKNPLIVSHRFMWVELPQKVVFGLDKDPLKQIISLQLILQGVSVDSKVVDRVDLRFDKPVIIYSAKRN